MSSTEALFQQYGPAYKWLATGTAMLSTLSMTLATTIVNVAIPDIMGNFALTQTKAQWLSTGFLAAMAAFMLLSSWVTHTFGMRASYVTTLGLFMLAAVLGGMSVNEDMVIVSRILQGAMAGIIQPLAMTVIFRVFPDRQRGLGMGIYGLGVILGPAIGPALGGVLVDWFSWRAVFYMPLPTCMLSIAAAAFFAPDHEAEAPKVRFDWTGFVLLCVFLGSLLWTLSNGQRLGWSSLTIYGGASVALSTGAAFIAWELFVPQPLLDVRIFRNLGFAAGSAIGFFYGAGLFGSTYLIPLFVQQIQGFTATAAGLLLMPAGLAMGLAFPLAGYLSDRLPAPTLINVGTLLVAVSCYALSFIDVYTLPLYVMLWVVVGRIGLGIGMPPISTGSLRTLPLSKISQGSGASNFSRQLGGAVGVNLLSLVLDQRTTHHASALADTQTAGNAVTAEVIARFHAIGPSLGLSPDQWTPQALRFLGEAIHFQAYAAGYRDSFLALTFLFVLALVPGWIMRRSTRQALPPEQQQTKEVVSRVDDFRETLVTPREPLAEYAAEVDQKAPAQAHHPTRSSASRSWSGETG